MQYSFLKYGKAIGSTHVIHCFYLFDMFENRVYTYNMFYCLTIFKRLFKNGV